MSDETLEFNLDDLTIGEICEIEELTNQPFDALNDPTKPKGRMLQAMAFISKRRTNPDFTFEDAGAIKISMNSDEVGPTSGDE